LSKSNEEEVSEIFLVEEVKLDPVTENKVLIFTNNIKGWDANGTGFYLLTLGSPWHLGVTC